MSCLLPVNGIYACIEEEYSSTQILQLLVSWINMYMQPKTEVRIMSISSKLTGKEEMLKVVKSKLLLLRFICVRAADL